MVEAGVHCQCDQLRRPLVRESAIAKFRGYIEQKKLWGVYEGEVIK